MEGLSGFCQQVRTLDSAFSVWLASWSFCHIAETLLLCICNQQAIRVHEFHRFEKTSFGFVRNVKLVLYSSAGAKCSLKNRVQIAFLADHNRKSSGNKVARKDSNLVFQKQIQKLASVPVVLVVFFPSMAHRKKRNSIPSTQPATDQPLFHNNTLHEAWNCTSWRNKTGMHANPF